MLKRISIISISIIYLMPAAAPKNFAKKSSEDRQEPGMVFSQTINGKVYGAKIDSNSNTMQVFVKNLKDDSLTPLAGSPYPFQMGDGLQTPAFSPIINGKLFLAVTSYAHNNVLVFELDVKSEQLTPVTRVSTSWGPLAGSFSPIVNAKVFLAVPNDGNTIQV